MPKLESNNHCKICGRELVDLPYFDHMVGCPVHDIPEESKVKVYEFNCWVPGCPGRGTSLTCKKSKTPGMGYCCPICNKDLTEWKLAHEPVVTVDDILAVSNENREELMSISRGEKD